MTFKFHPEAEKEFNNIRYRISNGKELIFGGYVDRLDSNGNGKYRIVDYKTGKNRFRTNENLFQDNDSYVHFQHAIYGLWALAQEEYPIKETDLEAGYYFTSSKGGWALVIAPFSNFKNQLKDTMKIFYESLKSGEFSKNAESCRNCEYQIICSGFHKRRRSFVGIPPQIAEIQISLEGK